MRMSFSLLEATHLHVVLGQEQVGGALLLWEVDTNLYECTESRQLLSRRDASAIKMKAHITSFSLSHKSVVEFSGLLILIQLGIQSENIHTKIIIMVVMIMLYKISFHLASFMSAVPSWSLNAMARNRHCTVIQCHVIR